MKVKTILLCGLLALCGTFFNACQSEYESWVSKELATGTRHDDLLLGIKFGMTKNDFFQYCLELNRQNVITNGPENSTAQLVKNDMGDNVDLNFYPDFHEDKIHIFRMYFNNKNWSPWNKEFHSDKLLPDVLEYLSRAYSTEFKELKSPSGKPLWVSIAGNRQIRVFVKDNRVINVDISDLSITSKNPKLVPNHPKVAE